MPARKGFSEKPHQDPEPEEIDLRDFFIVDDADIPSFESDSSAPMRFRPGRPPKVSLEPMIVDRSELPSGVEPFSGDEPRPTNVPFDEIPINYLIRRGPFDIPKLRNEHGISIASSLYLLARDFGVSTMKQAQEQSRFIGGKTWEAVEYVKGIASDIEPVYGRYLNTAMAPMPKAITNRMTLGKMTSVFIAEYLEQLRRDAPIADNLGGGEKSDLSYALDLLSEVYLDEPYDETSPVVPPPFSYTYTSLSEKFGLSKEKVRLLLQKYTYAMFDIMNLRSSLLHLNIRMSRRLSMVGLDSVTTMPYSAFMDKVGKCGPKTALFLLEYCGYVVFDRCPRMENFIIPGGYITDVNFALLKLLKYFRENPIPLTPEQLDSLVSSVSDDPAVRDILIFMVKTSEVFSSKVLSSGTTVYFMQWEYLEKTLSQIERIVYDLGKPLFLDEVVSEFRRRSIECNVPLPDINIKLVTQSRRLDSSFPGGAIGLRSWHGDDDEEEKEPDYETTIEEVKGRSKGLGRGELLRIVAECIHKKGGRAKLTDIKTYVHETTGSVCQVGKIKDAMDVAPDLFKAQASKARNAFYILRRPVDGLDFSKYD